ncbi:MAG: M13 family metallopeptidase [Haliangiales bacterium]
MRPYVSTWLICLSLAASAACGSKSPANTTADQDAPVVDVGMAEVGLDPAALDPDADPCEDFYRYTCGGWLDATEIPADRARYARFSEVAERNELVLRDILEAAAKSPADASQAKLGNFYSACMDEGAIDSAGLSGIEPLLARARAVAVDEAPSALPAAITELHRHGVWAIFDASPQPDFKDSSTNILFLDTNGLGLPDREYYLSDDDNFRRAREFYRGHLARMFALAGYRDGAEQQAADDVMAIEKSLAEHTKTRVERRDVEGLYNPATRAELAAKVPGFAWDTYFERLERPDLAGISVTTPGYLEHLAESMTRFSGAAWRHYLEWHILHHAADTLPEPFRAENFALRKQLTGQSSQRPRWKRCVAATDGALGELLGQQFVAARFAGDSKTAADTMVSAISQAFAAELDELTWMQDRTKERAMAKLAKMRYQIGYPDTWRKYGFEVERDNYAANVLRAQEAEVLRQLAKVDQPVDRGEWFMTPQTVNAYYNPLANQMTFPAGILQSPFFGADRSVAANLGAIGMVVGHELTHGFDDSGARFDADGNLENWWQDADATTFAQKGECLAEQYSHFEVLPGVTVNGKLTLGENIADLGGVKLAYRAYQSLRKDAPERYRADGLSEDQQFFVAVGQAWCSKDREAEARRRVVVDSHSPPRFRINGTLRNLPAFAEAFDCGPESAMRPEAICEVW